MSAKKLMISTIIAALAGIVACILLGKLEGGYTTEEFLFFPIWAIGVYFCGTPWNRIFKIWLALEAFKVGKRVVSGDRYHVIETLLQGCIFALIISVGWIYGLGKFVFYVIKVVAARRIV